MAYDVTRNLGPGISGSYTYESVGNAEDLSDILVNIDPNRTKFYSTFGTAEPAISTSFEWFTERLRPPQDNAHFEDEEYEFKEVGSQEGLQNWIQHFQGTGKISDTQNSVKKVWRRGTTEFNAAVDQAMRGMADDIELMIVTQKEGYKETPGSRPARSGGIPYFLRTNEMEATFATNDEVTLPGVTVNNPIDLKTGDFVYFIAGTMPGGVTSNKAYYIRLTEAGKTLKNIFTLHRSLEDAVNNTNKVDVTSAGTDVKMVRRNVISKNNDAQGWALSDISDVLQMIFLRGGKANQAYMSLANKRFFSKLINAETQNQRDASKAMTYNEAATAFYSDFGTITAHAHMMYPDSRIDILDMQYWDLKYLHKPHEVPREKLAKTGTYEKFVVEAALGLKGTAPQASGALVDITLP